MVLKAIEVPQVELVNANTQKSSSIVVEGTSNTELSESPLFEGVYYINEESNEYVDQYRFELYKIKDGVESLLEDTGWLSHNVSNDIKYNE